MNRLGVRTELDEDHAVLARDLDAVRSSFIVGHTILRLHEQHLSSAGAGNVEELLHPPAPYKGLDGGDGGGGTQVGQLDTADLGGYHRSQLKARSLFAEADLPSARTSG